MRSSRIHAGFTLIELLVVIAIIAILAAILFPVFAQAREKARAITCISNTKQMGLGFVMYNQDYDETYAWYNWGAQAADANGVNAQRADALSNLWVNAIYPYVKNAQIFKCPDTNDQSTLDQNCAWGWAAHCGNGTIVNSGLNPALVNAVVSEVGNQQILEGDYCTQASGPCTEAAVDRPAQSFIIADGIPAGMDGWQGGSTSDLRPDRTNPADTRHQAILSRVAYANLPGNAWGNQSQCGGCQNDDGNYGPYGAMEQTFVSQTRHSQGENLAFCDGHSKFVRDTAITRDYAFGDFAQ